MAKKLYVGNLSYDTTETALRDLFAPVGEVASVTIITDRMSGRSKGFGFVEMATEEGAQKAIADVNGRSLDGRQITVAEARPMQPREGGFGGGGRGGRGGSDRRGGGGSRRY
jgi:cold-inducible RNA-binding protein